MEREEVFFERMENPSKKEEVFIEALGRTATEHQSLQQQQQQQQQPLNLKVHRRTTNLEVENKDRATKDDKSLAMRSGDQVSNA
jgi:cysteine synthase